MESIAPNWKMKKYQSQYRFDLQVSGIMRIMLRLIQVSEPTAVVSFLLDCSALWVLYICLTNDLSLFITLLYLIIIQNICRGLFQFLQPELLEALQSEYELKYMQLMQNLYFFNSLTLFNICFILAFDLVTHFWGHLFTNCT